MSRQESATELRLRNPSNAGEVGRLSNSARDSFLLLALILFFVLVGGFLLTALVGLLVLLLLLGVTLRLRVGDDRVDALTERRELLVEVLLRGVLTLLVQPGGGFLGLLLDLLLVVLGDELLDVRRLRLVDVLLQSHLGGGLVREDLVLLLVLLRLLNHTVDLLLGEPGLVVLDLHVTRRPGVLVLRLHLQDTVLVDVHRNLDLRHTAGSHLDAVEVELAQQAVVLRHGTLTLVDLEEDVLLVVLGGGDGLLLRRGDDGVTGDHLKHHTADGLDTQGEGDDVHEHHLLATDVTRQHTTLNRSAVGDSLVGVDTTVRLLAVEE
eukprot:Hpha_TRINITY_DN16349_c8_g2::TRINITY_DN16349_c8_g2_i4::g.61518::m.61518